MFRTTVPKAPVDEYSDAQANEGDVCDPAGLCQDWNLNAIAQPLRTEFATQKRFGTCIFLPNALHAPARLR